MRSDRLAFDSDVARTKRHDRNRTNIGRCCKCRPEQRKGSRKDRKDTKRTPSQSESSGCHGNVRISSALMDTSRARQGRLFYAGLDFRVACITANMADTQKDILMHCSSRNFELIGFSKGEDPALKPWLGHGQRTRWSRRRWRQSRHRLAYQGRRWYGGHGRNRNHFRIAVVVVDANSRGADRS